jgi:polyisoprenoid-binding protein YceI
MKWNRLPEGGKHMAAHYQMDAAHSEFTVQGFASGMLSFLAHSPRFAVRKFAGVLDWDADAADDGKLVVDIGADSLELLDVTKPADRQEIECRMRGDVLDVTRFPTIRFETEEVRASHLQGERYRLRLNGMLSLHGVTNPHALDAELQLFTDGVRLMGETSLRLSDYRIPPVTALAGAIRLNDALVLKFNIPAWRQT